ncbi:MAG: GYD domain-containing protein [Pseudomonadota bacterium]
MPKYLFQASYTAEGLRALQKDSGTGRREAAAQAMKSIGGTLESFYFALGEHDVYIIVDAPDNTAVSALAIAVSASGLVKTQVTPLLTVQEVDAALKKSANYRPPGR